MTFNKTMRVPYTWLLDTAGLDPFSLGPGQGCLSGLERQPPTPEVTGSTSRYRAQASKRLRPWTKEDFPLLPSVFLLLLISYLRLCPFPEQMTFKTPPLTGQTLTLFRRDGLVLATAMKKFSISTKAPI